MTRRGMRRHPNPNGDTVTVHRFQKIQTRREKPFTCEVCGKRGRKAQTFYQTVSPFNRHEDGTLKTPREIGEAVAAEANAWEPEPIHDKCREVTA